MSATLAGLALSSETLAADKAEMVQMLNQVTDAATGDFKPELRTYQPALPREFSNGAIVDTRWALTRGGQVVASDGNGLRFPDGAILAKRFSYFLSEKARLSGDDCTSRQVSTKDPKAISEETRNGELCPTELRVLRKTKGVWKPAVYVWLDGKWKPSPAGELISLFINSDEGPRSEEIEYAVPSLGECVSCHLGSRSAKTFHPIGMTLDRLTSASFSEISGIEPPFDRSPRVGAIPTSRNSNEKRARAYLHANCGFCHNPNGLAASSGLMLDLVETDEYRLGVCKRPVAFGGGREAGSFDVVPGHPEQSIMVSRMASLRPGYAMPEQGRSLLDGDGILIVAEWIAGMKGDCDRE